jgi:hypothetical protein
VSGGSRRDPLGDLEQELLAAQRLARDPRCALAVDALDLRIDGPGWGIGFASFTGTLYEPAPDGDAAILIACEVEAELVDLLACRLHDRAAATRRGVAAVLGHLWIDRARAHGERLIVHRDALAWLKRGAVGATIIDRRRGLPCLSDVPALLADSEMLATQLQGGLAVLGSFPVVEFV